MKKYILILFVFSGFIAGQNLITVEDAIKIGLRNNYDIKIARNDAEIAENNSGLGTAGFLPTLDLSGNVGLTDSKSESNSPYSFGDAVAKNWGVKATLNWTLFDGFKMFANNSRYLQLEKLGKFQSRFIIENNIVGIMRSYFNLVLQLQLIDIAKKSLEISEQRFEKMKVRNNLGSVSSTDLLNAEVAYNNDRTTFFNQQLNKQVAQKDLNLLMGLPADTTFTVAGIIDIEENGYTLEELLLLAEKKNTSLLLADQSKRLAETGVKLNTSAFLPRVAFSTSYSYSDVNNSVDVRPEDIISQSTDISVGLSFSFNIFNGFRDKINWQNSIIELDKSTINYEKEKDKLRGIIIEKLQSYKNKIKIVDMEQANVKAAEQILKLWTERLEMGTINSREFRDAQISFIRAKTNQITALYSARIAELEIEQLIGKINIE